MPRKKQRLYRAYVLGQSDLEPNCVFAGPDLAFAQREVDSHLRSWVTSHSVETKPTIWIELNGCLKVYEAWIERRRVRNTQTGEVFLETPVQFWRDDLLRFGDGELKETPMRIEWFAHLSAAYEELEPLLNPKMVRH